MESAIIKKKYRALFREGPTIRRAFRILGVSEHECEEIGLGGIKKIAKSNYRDLVFGIHPDRGGRGWFYDKTTPSQNTQITLCDLKSLISLIESLKFMPLNMDNCNTLLEVMKGFKTTREVDYGLNGPA